MATSSKTVSAQSGDIQLAAQTYQQSELGINAVVNANASESGVVNIQPGQLSVVQVQAGKQYKLRKSGNPTQTPDDLVAVRHGDSLHVRYADGSMVHFEDFYSKCTDSSVCSVNLASDSASGVTLSADAASAGTVADDGLLVYAHGNPEVLMSMAQDQSGLSAALQSANSGGTLTYVAPSSALAMGALALLAVGALASAPGATAATGLNPAPNISEQETALRKIGNAAHANNASGSATPVVASLAIADYSKALVTGVDANNIAAINSALDSAAIDTDQSNTSAKVQGIVDAYKAILASADGTAANTITPLTGAQYTAIGVTGVSGVAAEGSALHLLNNVVDGKTTSGVDTVPEVQALADAAAHVLAAAGGTPAQIAALTLADLQALGITGVTADNLPAVAAAIGAATTDLGVDTKSEIQAIATLAEAKAATALNTISAAAQADNATATTPAATVYADAGVTGVTAGNLAAINSALDSAAVNGIAADTTAKVQGIVDAYNAILATADGQANTATPVLTAAQYAAIGVTGLGALTTAPAAGTALFLLDSAVDGKTTSDVGTVPAVQALADAAAHVLAAAGGTPAQIAALTLADLQALGITGVTAANLPAVLAAIAATTPDTGVDTKTELQAIATAVESKAIALSTISAAAEANNATAATPAATIYADAGVTGVTAGNLAAINSALDSLPVSGVAADTTAKVQGIVDVYNAILATADGQANTVTPVLTAAQYTAIGVTGLGALTTAPTAGTALFLLDNVVDGKTTSDVDTVPEVQALADAAAHVLAAAGGTPAQIAALTLADLQALGITGVTVDNLPAVAAAIGAATTDLGVDTTGEIQAIVTAAESRAAAALSPRSRS